MFSCDIAQMWNLSLTMNCEWDRFVFKLSILSFLFPNYKLNGDFVIVIIARNKFDKGLSKMGRLTVVPTLYY